MTQRDGAERAPTASRLVPGLIAVVGYLPALGLWLSFGNQLPGGRWLAIHIFTLGVVTNLISVFMPHFAATLTHAAPDIGGGMRRRVLLMNVGVIATLVGRAISVGWLVALGGALVSVAIVWLYRDLRRTRKNSLGSRFAFVVRAYERACGALLHGAFLGALMGIGVLPNDWHRGVRLAHLHLNLLGWAGMALLATVVTLGPVVARVRMEKGATTRAERDLPRAAMAITAAAVSLVFSGRPGAIGQVARALAGVALVAYIVSALGIILPAVRTMRRGAPSVGSSFLIAAFVAWAAAMTLDILGIASGSSRLMDAAGLIFLGGVLLQSILAALQRVVPLIWGGDPSTRRAALGAVAIFRRTRLTVINLGIALAAAAALVGTSRGSAGTLMTRVGWAGVAAGTCATIGLLVYSRMTVLRHSSDPSMAEAERE